MLGFSQAIVVVLGFMWIIVAILGLKWDSGIDFKV
jgi:hypothetical protein